MTQIHPDLLTLAQPVGSLSNLPGNPRRGDVDAVARSYEAFGQRKPIVARRADRVVLAGNHQLLAARQLGWSEIAVVFVDDDELTGNAFALADNKTSDLGEYDVDDLLAMLQSVHAEATADLFAATGFQQAELMAMIAAATPAVQLTDPDEAPPLPRTAFTQPADVWLLGPHRVMCGSATITTDVQRLVEALEVDMVWTDPPYGVSYQSNMSVGDAKRRNRRQDGLEVANDTLTAEQLQVFLRDAFTNALGASRPGAAYFVAAPSGPQFADFGIVLRDLDIWRQTLVWAKDVFVFGRADYHYRHESIFYGWKPGAAHHAVPDRTQDTVWEIPRPRQSKEHPTMKPTALIARALINHTDEGATVLDLFGGSGSTLIAAHGLGRIARLMELDPIYVDVICRRFQEHTGILPVLERTGETHDFTQ